MARQEKKGIPAEVAKAEGLRDSDRRIVELLFDKHENVKGRNRQRSLYYADEQAFLNLGLTVPHEFENQIKTNVGWCAKAVDMLGNRSQLDAVTADGEAGEELAEIVEDNELSAAYDFAKTPELIHGCGFWIPAADSDMRSGVSLNYYDAETGAGLWDYRHHRAAAGLIIADYEEKRGGKLEPALAFVYTPTDVITLERVNDRWYAYYEPHRMGRAPFVPMVYRPTNAKPFGRSRISKTCMAITDSCRRELLRTELHSEVFSMPQRYLLGIDENAAKRSKFNLYMDALLMMSRDENGDLPQIGQFSQASMTPHIEMLDKLAARMASETSIPVSAFGIQHATYISNESLRASSDDLILECESLNATNGRALRDLARMALAIRRGVPLASLDDEARAVAVKWRSPYMPSLASATDAMSKQAAITPWLAETALYWERLGYDEQERAELFKEKEAAEAAAALNNMLFGGE